MASQLKDEDVDTLMAITSQLSRDQSVRFLQISDYNVEAALNKFFEQGLKAIDNANTAWDGSAFGGSNTYQNVYGPQPESNPTFHIDYAPGVDHYPHSGIQSGAPSRPPSRTSQRSGTSSMHVDAPLQSIENQESGFIGNQKPGFRPATGNNYDEKQWGMVVSSSAELVPDAAPHGRKRENNPAIIKPEPVSSYLPALLTILHSIPVFRNALLTPQVSKENYGTGGDWWKGSASTPTRIFDSSSDNDAIREHDLIYETQRLMAFLDKTDRAYASLGSLRQLDAFNESSPALEDPNDDLLRFLLNWGSAYESQTPGAELNGVLRSRVKVGENYAESFLLVAPIIRQNYATEQNLYDVLDEIFFADSSRTAHLVDVSNVLIMRLSATSPDATGLECKIPATFHVDRYMEENKAAVTALFSEMKQYKSQLEEIDTNSEKFKYHTSIKTGKSERMDALKLLKTSMRAFEKMPGQLVDDPKDSDVIKQIQTMCDSIERKLNLLDEEKKKIQESLDSVSSHFRAPLDDVVKLEPEASTEEKESMPKQPSPYKPEYLYKLCGVSTRPSVFYLPDPSIAANDKNWWRIEYSTATSEAYIFREQLDLTQVVERASSENSSALLVYANEAATSIAPVPLTKPLKDFIDHDNVKFMEELQSSFGDYNMDNNNDNEVAEIYHPTRPWKHVNDNTTYSTNWVDQARAQADYNGQGSGQSWVDQARAQTDYHGQSSGQSSTTLTPNTDIEDEGVSMEMQEVSNGTVGWPGTISNASSDTVGGESMDLVNSQPPKTVNLRDVEMRDVDLTDDDKEPRSQHIETIERKGG